MLFKKKRKKKSTYSTPVFVVTAALYLKMTALMEIRFQESAGT